MTTLLVAKSTSTFTGRFCVQTKKNSSSLFYLVAYLTTLSVIQIVWIKKGRLKMKIIVATWSIIPLFIWTDRGQSRELSLSIMYALWVASLGGWTAVLQRSVLLRLGYDTSPSVLILSCFLFFLRIASFSLPPWNAFYFILLLSLSVPLLLSTASFFLSFFLCFSILPSTLLIVFSSFFFSFSPLFFLYFLP